MILPYKYIQCNNIEHESFPWYFVLLHALTINFPGPVTKTPLLSGRLTVAGKNDGSSFHHCHHAVFTTQQLHPAAHIYHCRPGR
jgi:hypothetical protein